MSRKAADTKHIEKVEGITDNDVLLGRGRRYDKHPGNLYFASLIVTFTGKYNATTSRNVKGRVAEEVVSTIYQNGGRFLKPENRNAWREAKRNEAQVKAAQALRYQYRRKFTTATATGNDGEIYSSGQQDNNAEEKTNGVDNSQKPAVLTDTSITNDETSDEDAALFYLKLDLEGPNWLI